MVGVALWITGLPGSGKSTMTDALRETHPDFIVLRMDEMRKIVTPEPSYSDTERELLYRSLVYMAKKLTENGHNVIIDATGNMRRWRDLARRIIPGYVEIFLKCPTEVCRDRESRRADTREAPKNIYAKGKNGWPVPGINAPYEEPVDPEISVEVEKTSASDAARLVNDYLVRRLSGH